MKYLDKALISMVLILVLLGLSLPKIEGKESISEICLLVGEIEYPLVATANVRSFYFSTAIPCCYEGQVPLLLEIKSNANILKYDIKKQIFPNRVLSLLLGPIKKGEKIIIRIKYWVFLKNTDYPDLPDKVEISKDLPKGTKFLLTSTKAIQSSNPEIKKVAKSIRKSNEDILELAQDIVHFTSNKPYIRGPQDALSSLRNGGVCTGKANLGTALFRSNSIPAKVLMVLPTDGKNWWYWIHFISEYYCPEYGWVRAETSYGETPWETKNDIVLRVIYPKDENKVDPYFRRVYNNIYTSGEEMWFWIHTDNAIVPNGGTDLGHYRAGGWIEKHFYTEEKKATEALFITNKVFDLYAKRFSKNYEKWLLELKKSISSLEKNDIGGYINQMESIYQELKEEELKELSLFKPIFALILGGICASFLLFRKFGRKSKF